MLEALLETDGFSTEELECVFLEALYCSLGATLLESGRRTFDEYIKKLSGMTIVHDAGVLAGTGEIPGEINTEKEKFIWKFILSSVGLTVLVQQMLASLAEHMKCSLSSPLTSQECASRLTGGLGFSVNWIVRVVPDPELLRGCGFEPGAGPCGMTMVTLTHTYSHMEQIRLYT